MPSSRRLSTKAGSQPCRFERHFAGLGFGNSNRLVYQSSPVPEPSSWEDGCLGVGLRGDDSAVESQRAVVTFNLFGMSCGRQIAGSTNTAGG
jgi:hypothetical protein